MYQEEKLPMTVSMVSVVQTVIFDLMSRAEMGFTGFQASLAAIRARDPLWREYEDALQTVLDIRQQILMEGMTGDDERQAN